MNKNIVLIVLVVLVIGAGAFYFLQPQKEEQGTMQKSIEPAETASDMQKTPSAQIPASPEVPALVNVPPLVKAEKPAVSATHAVTIQNFAFSPAEIKIKKGDTVAWTNNDTAPHTVSADSFHSATLQNGQSFRFIFATAGTYDYICGIHPRMTGTVIVQ